MLIKKRIIKAIAEKKNDDGSLKSRSVKISVRDTEGEGYKDVWPMVTSATKGAELLEKGAVVNMYVSDDMKFVNAVFLWEEKKDGAAAPSDDDVPFDVQAGAEAAATA